jgi:hypothetical protein
MTSGTLFTIPFSLPRASLTYGFGRLISSPLSNSHLTGGHRLQIQFEIVKDKRHSRPQPGCHLPNIHITYDCIQIVTISAVGESGE